MRREYNFNLAIALCSGPLLLLPISVAADPEPRPADVIAAEVPKKETGWEGDHLTGDWIGIRDILVDLGIHFYAGYAGEVLANVSGGMRQGVVYEGLFELGLDLDFEQMGLWEGAALHISSLYPHGPSLSGKYTGDLLTVSNIDAYDSFRLYELWFEKNQGMLSVRVGQLVADEEFAFTESGTRFINSAFGWPAFISGNVVNTGPAYFVATPGLRVRVEPTESVYLQAGVFDGDPFDSRTGDPSVNASGTRVHFSGDQGLFSIGEVGFRRNLAENTSGLSGEYKLGLWHHTADYSSNFRDRNGDPFVVSGLDPRAHDGNYGGYVAVEQMLWREEGEQGITFFARAGASPPDRSLFEYVVEGGLVWQGLIPDRDDDALGLGAVHARLSRDFRRSERLDARTNGTIYGGYSDHETVLEAFYSIHLTKWWSLQPDLQWIFNPGGNPAASDAVVVGVRTSLVF